MNVNTLRYIIGGLEATPIVLTRLLSGITDAELDTRPDPERFTLREALCHMADWEPIWLERMMRIVREDRPLLPGYDEGQMAMDNDYASQPFAETLNHFVTGRAALVAFLRERAESDWIRVGLRDELGELSLYELTAMTLGHDAYHLRQAAEFREQCTS